MLPVTSARGCVGLSARPSGDALHGVRARGTTYSLNSEDGRSDSRSVRALTPDVGPSPPTRPTPWSSPVRLLTVGLVLAAGIVVSTCKLDKLISPPSGGLLVVEPNALRDSAALGSTEARLQHIGITNAGAGRLAWNASVVQGSPWLSLGAASGTAPDTLPLWLAPSGLAAGDYRDTLVVASTGSGAGQLRIPVLFRVQPCAVLPIAVGSQVSGMLNGAACAAPHRSGRFAQLYSFAGSAGDSVTIELSSAAFNAYVILDSATNPVLPTLAQSETCPGVAGDACLLYERLPRTGTYVIEATTAAPAASEDYVLRLSPPRPPVAPDTLLQLLGDSATTLPTGGTLSRPVVVLRGVVSDPDRGDSLRLEVEVQPVTTAFTGTGTVLGAPVANGQRALVRVAGLANYTSYHWRARVV